MEASNTRRKVNEIESIDRAATMDFDAMRDLVLNIIEVRKRYARDYMKSNFDSPEHLAASNGIDWCNAELMKLLFIVPPVEF